jgi:RNA polymerase sigma-70 factor (ECF subfamily)
MSMPAAPGPIRLVPPDVGTLVERARARDAAATHELFRMHLPATHRLVRRLLGPRGDVDDVVQAAFFEAFRSLHTFRGEASFSTWLTRIALRVTMNAVGRRAPTVPMSDLAAGADPRSPAPDPEEVAAAREGLARVDALLARMSAKRRAAFVLHVLEGHSVEEVAEILGASAAAVRVRIHDARREIEQHVSGDPSFLGWLKRRRQRS